MKTSGWSEGLRGVVDAARSTPTYFAELVKLKVATSLRDLMTRQGVTGRELARRLNKSEAHVSKLLRGDKNLTIDTIVEVAHTLGAQVDLKISTPKASSYAWIQFESNPLVPAFTQGADGSPRSLTKPTVFYGRSEFVHMAEVGAVNDAEFHRYDMGATSAA